ncbi:MAG: cation transporter [Clostridia bacterium]|nr:cation transporter [Clostridia bacterium]
MTKLLIRKFVANHDETADPKVRAAYGKLSGIVGIVCNILLFAAKIIIGIMSSSVAIVADAVNNFTDAASSIISLIGFRLSEKPADKEHPYGHGRYEYLAAMGIAVLIIVIGIELFKSGIEKILNPAIIVFSFPLGLVLILSIVLKLWMMAFNRYAGGKINSKALLAASADSRNDVIATTAVLVSAIFSHIFGVDLDGWMGVGVSIFILTSGFGIVKDTIDPMLGNAPNPEYIESIKTKILSYPGVLGMHDLIVHDYGPCRKFASVHVEMAAEEDVIETHDVIDNIERDMLEEIGLHLIVHFDPVVTNDTSTQNLRRLIEDVVTQIDASLTIHDLRVVQGSTHTNLVFDCVAPYEIKISDSTLKELIEEKVKGINSEYNCVITIDKSSAN